MIPRHCLHICGGSGGCASTKPIIFTVVSLVGRSGGTFKGALEESYTVYPNNPKYIYINIMNDVRIINIYMRIYRFVMLILGWYLVNFEL